MSHPSLAYMIVIIGLRGHVLGLHTRAPPLHPPSTWWSWWCGLVANRPSAISLAFSSICSFSCGMQQWARITLMSCYVWEKANPSLRNLPLNLSGFSENLANLSLQINPVTLRSLFGMSSRGPLKHPKVNWKSEFHLEFAVWKFCQKVLKYPGR